MGSFSWLYADTGRQMVNGRKHKSYLLIPKPFRKKVPYLTEPCYEGFGCFGRNRADVYELALEWNRDCIPKILDLSRTGKWECPLTEQEREDLLNFHLGRAVSTPLRRLGIAIACYDSDNARLLFPIKITEKPMLYEECKNFSHKDRYQGFHKWAKEDDAASWWPPEHEDDDYE